MNYEILIPKLIHQNRDESEIIFVKQYENKYTHIQFTNLEIDPNYDYVAVYKKEGCSEVYELPLENNILTIGTFITNYVGTYRMCVVATNDDERVVITDWFTLKVQEGIYNKMTADVVFPQPIQSKYEQLIELVEEIEGKLERGEFKGETGNGIAYCTFSNYKLTLHFTDGTEYTTTSIRGERGERGEQGVAGRDGKDGSDYVITESDYNAIANITANTLQPTITELSNVKADKTDIPTKTSELINDSDFTTKAYVDDEVSKATPSDYEQVKDDIALLKWKTLNLATEIVDSTEAYTKSVPSNVYEKALLNGLGGKSVVDEGTIKSANVESVVSEGVNLAPITTAKSTTIKGITFVNNGDGTIDVSGVATDYFTYLLYDKKPINL